MLQVVIEEKVKGSEDIYFVHMLASMVGVLLTNILHRRTSIRTDFRSVEEPCKNFRRSCILYSVVPQWLMYSSP